MVRSGCCDSTNGDLKYFADRRGITLFSTSAHRSETTILEIDEHSVCHLILLPRTRIGSTSNRVNARSTSHNQRQSFSRDRSFARNKTQPHPRHRSDSHPRDEGASYCNSMSPDGFRTTFNEEPLHRPRNSSSYQEPVTTDTNTARRNSRIPTNDNGWNREAFQNQYHSSRNSHSRPEGTYGRRSAYDAGHARTSDSTSSYQRPAETPRSRGRSRTTAYVNELDDSDSTFVGKSGNYRRRADYRTRPSSPQPIHASGRRRTYRTAEYASGSRGRPRQRSMTEEGCMESIARSISRSISAMFRSTRSRRSSMNKTSRHRSRSYKEASAPRTRSNYQEYVHLDHSTVPPRGPSPHPYSRSAPYPESRWRSTSRSAPRGYTEHFDTGHHMRFEEKPKLKKKTGFVRRNGHIYGQVRFTDGGMFEAGLDDSGSSDTHLPGFGRK
jgi:hypothetical protein